MTDQLETLPPTVQLLVQQLALLLGRLAAPVPELLTDLEGVRYWQNRCPHCGQSSEGKARVSSGLTASLTMAEQLPITHGPRCALAAAQELMQTEPLLRQWANAALMRLMVGPRSEG